MESQHGSGRGSARGLSEGDGLESDGNRLSGRWSVQDGEEGEDGQDGKGSPADSQTSVPVSISSVPIIMYHDEFPVSLGKK